MNSTGWIAFNILLRKSRGSFRVVSLKPSGPVAATVAMQEKKFQRYKNRFIAETWKITSMNVGKLNIMKNETNQPHFDRQQ